MSKRLFTLGLALVCLFAFAADAFAKPVKLEYNLAKGDSARYSIKMDSKMSVGYQTKVEKVDTQATMTMKQQVVDKDEAGTLYMLTAIEDVKTVVNGIPVDAATNKSAEKVFTMHIKPNGEIVSAQGLQQEMSMQQMQLAFPTKPVDVGSTWEHVIPENPPSITVPLHMKYEVTGFKKVGDKECVVIKSTVTSKPKDPKNQESLDVKADGEIVFDFEGGKIVENKVKGNFGQVSVQDIAGKLEPVVTKVDITLEMKLVK